MPESGNEFKMDPKPSRTAGRSKRAHAAEFWVWALTFWVSGFRVGWRVYDLGLGISAMTFGAQE